MLLCRAGVHRSADGDRQLRRAGGDRGLLSATQDVVIDARRIEIADESATVDLLSAIYQLGNRLAALTGGALALVLAARLSWPTVYIGFGGVMIGALAMTLFTPEAERNAADEASPLAGHSVPRRHGQRAVALGIVAVCWAWAIYMLGSFMIAALRPPVPGVPAPSAGAFTQVWGPWIIVATVILPALVAGWTNRLPRHRRRDRPRAERAPGRRQPQLSRADPAACRDRPAAALGRDPRPCADPALPDRRSRSGRPSPFPSISTSCITRTTRSPLPSRCSG